MFPYSSNVCSPFPHIHTNNFPMVTTTSTSSDPDGLEENPINFQTLLIEHHGDGLLLSRLLSQQQLLLAQADDYQVELEDSKGSVMNNKTTSRSSTKACRRQRISGKKDRHSKICTAQGPRDRRMRLSLQIARKFFHLQDMLGFDKASKTIEWLILKSKSAIKELKDKINGAANSESHVLWSAEKEEESKMKKRQIKKQLYACKAGLKESRDKARERARERTRQKMKIRGCGLDGLDLHSYNNDSLVSDCLQEVGAATSSGANSEEDYRGNCSIVNNVFPNPSTSSSLVFMAQEEEEQNPSLNYNTGTPFVASSSSNLNVFWQSQFLENQYFSCI